MFALFLVAWFSVGLLAAILMVILDYRRGEDFTYEVLGYCIISVLGGLVSIWLLILVFFEHYKIKDKVIFKGKKLKK